MRSSQGRPWLETVGFCGPSGRAPPISSPASGILAGADAAWNGVWLLSHTQLYKYVHISGFGGLGLQPSGPQCVSWWVDVLKGL